MPQATVALIALLLSTSLFAQVTLNNRTITMSECRDRVVSADSGCVGRKVLVSWTPPIARENGNRLRSREIGHYNIVFTGQNQSVITDTVSGKHHSYTRFLTSGLWAATISAMDTNGLESQPSSTVVIEIP